MLRDVGVQVDDSEPNVWRVAPGRDQRRGPARRARPVQRRAVPGGGAGHRRPGAVPGLAGRAPPRPATRCATSSTRWAPTSSSTGDGPDRHRHAARSHGHRRRPARRRRADPGRRGARRPRRLARPRLRGVAHLRGHETDRLAALAKRDQRPRRRRRPRPTTACASARARCTAGVPHLRRPPAWRTAGASSAWRSPGVRIEDVATDGEDPAGLPRAVDRGCSASVAADAMRR